MVSPVRKKGIHEEPLRQKNSNWSSDLEKCAFICLVDQIFRDIQFGSN